MVRMYVDQLLEFLRVESILTRFPPSLQSRDTVFAGDSASLFLWLFFMGNRLIMGNVLNL